MPVEPGVIFYFCNVLVNITQNTPFKNIKWFENDDHFSETMSGETCWRDSVSWLFWHDISSNLLRFWVNGEEYWNGVFCKLLPDALTKLCMNPASLIYTLLQKRCKFKTYSRITVSWILGADLYSNILRLWENDVEFWNRVLPRSYQEHNVNDTWCQVHWSIYTLPQKKCNLQEPAFLLGKSVIIKP